MRRQAPSEIGFTTLELLLVVAVLVVLSAISIPLMGGVIQRAQASGAGDALATAIRDARMRAIATGWQYQVVAYDSAGAVPDAFRIQGTDPASGAGYPAVGTATSPPVYGSVQMSEPYSSMARDFGGARIAIPAGGPTFTVTFDSRGQWATPCVPVSCQIQTNASGGSASTITVSQAGAVLVSR